MFPDIVKENMDQRCACEPLDETRQRRELWLRPGSEAYKALVKTERLAFERPGSSNGVHPHNSTRGTVYSYIEVFKRFVLNIMWWYFWYYGRM